MHESMKIYQMLPRLFLNKNATNKQNGSLAENGSGQLEDLSPAILNEIKELGFDTLWLTGLLDHATAADFAEVGKPASHPDILKGVAGSPYAIRDARDMAPYLFADYGKRWETLQKVVENAKVAGLKILIDFVPNHTAREYIPSDPAHFPAKNDDTTKFFDKDNFYYYVGDEFVGPLMVANRPYEERPAKATGNDVYNAAPTAYDWYETVKINYGLDPRTGEGHYSPTPSTWMHMRDNVLFWAGKGVDGLRCDMVDMVPMPFWSWLLAEVRAQYPAFVFVGESYDEIRYEGFVEAGFDYLYDKVGMYDAMRNWMEGHGDVGRIGQTMWNSRHYSNHLLRFAENHDEQRLASRQVLGNYEKGMAMLGAVTLAGQGCTMVYMGEELGEAGDEKEGFSGADGKTTIFDFWGLSSLQAAYLGMGHTKDGDTKKHLMARLMGYKCLGNPDWGLFNLQAYNTAGYGGLSFDDAMAFVRFDAMIGKEMVVVVVARETNIHIEIMLPAALFDAIGKGIEPNEAAIEYFGAPQDVTLKPIEGGLLLSFELKQNYMEVFRYKLK